MLCMRDIFLCFQPLFHNRIFLSIFQSLISIFHLSILSSCFHLLLKCRLLGCSANLLCKSLFSYFSANFLPENLIKNKALPFLYSCIQPSLSHPIFQEILILFFCPDLIFLIFQKLKDYFLSTMQLFFLQSYFSSVILIYIYFYAQYCSTILINPNLI